MAEPTVGQPDGPYDGTVDELSSTLAPINGIDASAHTGGCPAVAGVGCYSMRTDRGAWGDVELGSTTALRYFFGRDLVLPQSALWDYSYDDITYLTLALPFLVLAYRCWTAYRSRRQHATAPPRAGDPLASRRSRAPRLRWTTCTTCTR